MSGGEGRPRERRKDDNMRRRKGGSEERVRELRGEMRLVDEWGGEPLGREGRGKI